MSEHTYTVETFQSAYGHRPAIAQVVCSCGQAFSAASAQSCDSYERETGLTPAMCAWNLLQQAKKAAVKFYEREHGMAAGQCVLW